VSTSGLVGGEAREPIRARRLFFALWPDAALRESVAAATHDLARCGGGRPQTPEQLHLTLIFLGSVPEARIDAASSAAGEVGGAPFVVDLDRLEYWARPRVLCLTTSRTPPHLLGLVESLATALRARGFEVERRPFRAHLTLARDARPPPLDQAIAPLAWPASEFVLVESVTDRAGARYRPLARWPLAAAAPAATD